MDDPVPPVVPDALDHAWQSAQRLAIDVINYPTDQRDEVMRQMGNLLTEVAREAGCTREMAREFGNAMEQAIRDYVEEIKASGGGTVGTA
jgi:phytoene/squalene synthetase